MDHLEKIELNLLAVERKIDNQGAIRIFFFFVAFKITYIINDSFPTFTHKIFLTSERQ